jgi:hypothetical protein
VPEPSVLIQVQGKLAREIHALTDSRHKTDSNAAHPLDKGLLISLRASHGDSHCLSHRDRDARGDAASQACCTVTSISKSATPEHQKD